MDIRRILLLIEDLLKKLKLNSKFAFALSGSAALISCLLILYKLRNEIFNKNNKKVIVDESLSISFKDMLTEMNNRFLNFQMVPIVININCSKSMPTLGSDNVRFSNSPTVNWIVNDRMAIVNIFKDYEMVLKKLQDMTNGFGFQCVNFHIDYENITETYKVECLSTINQYRNIVTKFGINATCFIVAHVSDVDNIIDKKTSIGTRNNSETSLVDEFVKQVLCEDKIMDMGLFTKVNHLSGISDYFFDMFGHYGLKLSGFYMCSSLSNEYTFIEDFLTVDCYNACSEVKINFKYYSMKSKVFSIVRKTVLIFLLILTPLFLTKTYLMYGDLNRTEKVMYDICHEKPVSLSENEHVRLQADMDGLSRWIIGSLFKNENISNKTLGIINNYNLKILNGLSGFDGELKEVFDISPMDTNMYKNTLRNIGWIFENIKIDESNRVNIENKIDFLCDRLFKNYQNTSLLIKIDKLIKSINDIDSQGLSPEKMNLMLSQMYNDLNEITKYMVPNLWWNSNNYQLRFNLDIESIVTDEQLKIRIIERHDRFLSNFKDRIHNYHHRIFGKFFDEKFGLSDEFQEFRDLCDDIFSDLIFSVSFTDIKIPTEINQFPYFDTKTLMRNSKFDNVTSKVNSIKNDKQKTMFKKIVDVQTDIYLTHLVFFHTSFNDDALLSDKIHSMSEFLHFSESIKLNESYIKPLINSGLKIICEDIKRYVNDNFIKLTSEEISDLLSGNTNEAFKKYHYMISSFNDLNKMIDKIIFYLRKYDIPTYDYIHNINEAILNRQGQLFKLSEFINSFCVVEDKYRKIINYSNVNEDLISWKCNDFMNEVIDAHNNQLSSENVKVYQDLVNIFNEEIKDYLINFSKSKLNHLDVTNSIKKFITKFSNIKQNLYADEYFKTTSYLMNSIKKMQEFCNMFIVVDNKLFLNLEIKCHVTEDSILNDNQFISPLIHSYSIIAHDKKYQDIDNNGTIICRVNCENGFEFIMTLSEKLICNLPTRNAYDNFTVHVDKNVYRIIFNQPLNLIDFVNRLSSRVIEKDGTRQLVNDIVISVIDENGDKKYMRTGFIFKNFKSDDFGLHSFIKSEK